MAPFFPTYYKRTASSERRTIQWVLDTKKAFASEENTNAKNKTVSGAATALRTALRYCYFDGSPGCISAPFFKRLEEEVSYFDSIWEDEETVGQAAAARAEADPYRLALLVMYFVFIRVPDNYDGQQNVKAAYHEHTVRIAEETRRRRNLARWSERYTRLESASCHWFSENNFPYRRDLEIISVDINSILERLIGLLDPQATSRHVKHDIFEREIATHARDTPQAAALIDASIRRLRKCMNELQDYQRDGLYWVKQDYEKKLATVKKDLEEQLEAVERVSNDRLIKLKEGFKMAMDMRDMEINEAVEWAECEEVRTVLIDLLLEDGAREQMDKSLEEAKEDIYVRRRI